MPNNLVSALSFAASLTIVQGSPQGPHSPLLACPCQSIVPVPRPALLQLLLAYSSCTFISCGVIVHTSTPTGEHRLSHTLTHMQCNCAVTPLPFNFPLRPPVLKSFCCLCLRLCLPCPSATFRIQLNSRRSSNRLSSPHCAPPRPVSFHFVPFRFVCFGFVALFASLSLLFLSLRFFSFSAFFLSLALCNFGL